MGKLSVPSVDCNQRYVSTLYELTEEVAISVDQHRTEQGKYPVEVHVGDDPDRMPRAALTHYWPAARSPQAALGSPGQPPRQECLHYSRRILQLFSLSIIPLLFLCTSDLFHL